MTKTTPAVCPIDPHALNHFLAACQAASVTVTHLNPSDLRTLIQRLSRLSIPDAVKLLREGGKEQTFP